jgi:hypothetical protein
MSAVERQRMAPKRIVRWGGVESTSFRTFKRQAEKPKTSRRPVLDTGLGCLWEVDSNRLVTPLKAKPRIKCGVTGMG